MRTLLTTLFLSFSLFSFSQTCDMLGFEPIMVKALIGENETTNLKFYSEEKDFYGNTILVYRELDHARITLIYYYFNQFYICDKVKIITDPVYLRNYLDAFKNKEYEKKGEYWMSQSCYYYLYQKDKHLYLEVTLR